MARLQDRDRGQQRGADVRGELLTALCRLLLPPIPMFLSGLLRACTLLIISPFPLPGLLLGVLSPITDVY